VDRSNLVKRLGYTQVIAAQSLPLQLVERHVSLLSAWKIPPPKSLALEIAADPVLADEAARLLPAGLTLCHLSTSQVRKEWPLARWREFYQLARAAGWPLAFSSGTSERERALLTDLKKMEPDIFTLPAITNLNLFLAVLRHARALVVGDTGPLHFAAGLGIPVIGLFGADVSLAQVAGIYDERNIIKSTEFLPPGTPLSTNTDDPESALGCIPAERVFQALTAVAGHR
jgi:ADP-heptose:LPS heptosyltransferase